MSFPIIQTAPLPPNTIVPENKDLFIPYFNRTYEDIAFAVNGKDTIAFPFAITHMAQNIPNVNNFGSFLIAVSGSSSGMPTLTASLCKASSSSSGVINVIGSQAGTTGVWSGATLTITSTATNFQINHSVASTTGNFSIRLISSI